MGYTSHAVMQSCGCAVSVGCERCEVWEWVEQGPDYCGCKWSYYRTLSTDYPKLIIIKLTRMHQGHSIHGY